jgi:hypothetical protein
MADTLRELFEQMVADEPPLRTTSDSAAAAGRRLRARRRAGWAAAGAALAVLLLTAVPTLAATGRPAPSLGSPTAITTPAPSSEPLTPTAVSATEPQAAGSPYCPSSAQRSHVNTRTSDGSILPNVDRAAAAVLAAAPSIAPGKQFILRLHEYTAAGEKGNAWPRVALIFDVGDALGYGFLSFEIYPEQGVSAAERAQWGLDGHVSCFDVQRRDFADGSVAVDEPEPSTFGFTKVYYYAARGYDMNIDAHTEPWTTGPGPNDIPTPSTLSPRASVPLTVLQIMDLADALAHA